MYTQCPDCATVFRVTADALRAAHGDVRCGICSTTFNALENLSEQSFEPAPLEAEAPSPDDSMTVEELPGNENIELSEDQAMEFHGDAADLDRLFVVESPERVDFDPAEVAATLSVGGPSANDSDLDRTDEFPVLILDETDEPVESVEPVEPVESPRVVVPAASAPVESIVLAAEEPATPYGAPRILIPEEMRRRLAEEAAARSAFLSDFGEDEAAAPHRRWHWAVGVGVLLLLFAAQVVHSQRERLIQKPGLGPLIAQTYALLGQALTVPTDLSAYELRQWGAANDPNETERLLLRASIVNRASYAQPYPLLRLALQDRFGATLGVRDIEPKDYLPGSGAPGLLGPGQRADAEIRIVDPGREAVGFEMDICVPAGNGVRCANQITTAAQ
ncbi:MAG: DUF3426 domain-containing protein [Steroidobacteraceae bacterium]